MHSLIIPENVSVKGNSSESSASLAETTAKATMIVEREQQTNNNKQAFSSMTGSMLCGNGDDLSKLQQQQQQQQQKYSNNSDHHKQGTRSSSLLPLRVPISLFSNSRDPPSTGSLTVPVSRTVYSESNNYNDWESSTSFHTTDFHAPTPPTSNATDAAAAAAAAATTTSLSNRIGSGQPTQKLAPVSFIYSSARSTYSSIPIVDSIRQEVCSMTEGTRLVPINVNKKSNNNSHSSIRLLTSAIDILQPHCILGAGTFSIVTAVTIENRNTPCRNQQVGSKGSNGQTPPQPRYYACKSIKQELVTMGGSGNGGGNTNRSLEYIIAASQLAYEAHVLSSFDHPNIIKIRGLDADGILGFERSNGGLFLLMDVLQETLDQRIDRWRRGRSKNSSNTDHSDASLLFRRNIDKLDSCLQLASALEYVHSRNVVYRDLKPENIGFVTIPSPTNEGGTNTNLQLFDFGLCRELTTTATPLTGVTGTMRYMAPEVCLELNYDCDCDIYSYAIVCWELWTHQIPFKTMTTPDLYREYVCRRGFRPYPDQYAQGNYSRHYPQHPLHHQRVPLQDQVVQDQVQNPLPREILVLLSQAWKHAPKSRIRWSQTKYQLALLKQLAELQLEEHELSESSADIDDDDEHAHDCLVDDQHYHQDQKTWQQY